MHRWELNIEQQTFAFRYSCYMFRLEALIPRPSIKLCPFFCGATGPSRPWLPHLRGFTITFRDTTLGPLEEGSAWRRDLYLTHNDHNKEISMSPVGFETAGRVRERPQESRPEVSGWSMSYQYIVTVKGLKRCGATLLHRTGKKTGNLNLYNKYCRDVHNYV